MGTQDNSNVIPFSFRPRETSPAANSGQQDAMLEQALLRRRGFEQVESVHKPAAPAKGLTAQELSAHFIRSLDDMISSTPASLQADICWPTQRDAHLEKVAIDIVDMLFGFVLEDAQVSAGIKDTVLRAQMPILQLAMREPNFFADWQHPTRQLLNDIALMAKTSRDRTGSHAAFEQAFKQGLDLVLDDLAPNGAAFAEFHRRIHALACNESPARILSDEQTEQAWERAEAAARQFLERPLPPMARDFLAGYWVDVLQRTALLHPEDSLQWQDTVAVIEDLAWSLTPKSGQDERLQLIGLIPALLARLNRGLDLIEIERDDRRPFFDALIEIHTVVLRAELSRSPAVPASVFIELEAAEPVAETAESGIAQVSRLQRGDWVAFQQADGEISRERLTWISPQRGILVFSNHLGQRAIQISPEDLAQLVEAKKAMLIFDQPEATSDKDSA